MDNIKGSVFFPHFFKDGIKKEVIAICKVRGNFTMNFSLEGIKQKNSVNKKYFCNVSQF